MERNRVDLAFNIWNFEDISHNEITSLMGVDPFKVYIKGERRNPERTNSSLWKENGWILRADGAPYASFEDQMNSLLDILEGKDEVLKPLCEKYTCEFSCGIFIYYDNEESSPPVRYLTKTTSIQSLKEKFEKLKK